MAASPWGFATARASRLRALRHTSSAVKNVRARAMLRHETAPVEPQARSKCFSGARYQARTVPGTVILANAPRQPYFRTLLWTAGGRLNARSSGLVPQQATHAAR